MALGSELKVEVWDIDALLVDVRNIKTHTPEQVTQIASSIQRFGFNDPLGICFDTNLVVEGAGRLEAAKFLGLTQVPVIRLKFSSQRECRAYAIAHNQTQQLTRMDDAVVMEEFERLGVKPEDYGVMGYTGDDVAFMQIDATSSKASGEGPEDRVDTGIAPPSFAIQRAITSKVNFDSQGQLLNWLSSLDWLRVRYPDASRISERLVAFMDQYEDSMLATGK